MVHIGDKIRQLREERGISRADFCDTQEELSIRQLIRIEQGQSIPTLYRLEYIANRLGVPSYQIMPDYKELPARYKELKYLILRTPIYGNRDVLEQLELYLTEIIDNFFEELPQEEQFTIDCLEALVKMYFYDDTEYARPIIDEKIDKIGEYEFFSVNDLSYLILLTSFIQKSVSGEVGLISKYVLIFSNCFDKLLRQGDLFSSENLFVHTNSIIAGLSYFDLIGDYFRFPDSIVVLKKNVKRTQDFQKRPLIAMLEWKDSIFNKKDLANASIKYNEAKGLAEMLQIQEMISGFEAEWKKDLEKFSKK